MTGKITGRRNLAPAAVAMAVFLAGVTAAQLRAEGDTSLAMGEAYFMVGNLTEAAQHLQKTVDDTRGAGRARAFYLLARISLLTGDFPQAKEYFERTLDERDAGAALRDMSLVGIGDVHLAGGLYDEALRRYRRALQQDSRAVPPAQVEIRMALAEHYLGNHEEADATLSSALEAIPVMSHWLGREEEFYRSMAMTGIQERPEKWVRFYVVAGPLGRDGQENGPMEDGISVRDVRRDEERFREYGPFPDPIAAMIFSERVRKETGLRAEVVSR